MNLMYLSLGGNIGDTVELLTKALQDIAALPHITDFSASRYYRTTPVNAPAQNDYVNAACRFQTTLPLKTLWKALQRIETQLGKTPKPKDAPRPIDIDILFFGQELIQDHDLEIPHPRWHERLFVLIPLRDLTATLLIPYGPIHKIQTIDIQAIIDSFPHCESQRVFLLGHYPNAETIASIEASEKGIGMKSFKTSRTEGKRRQVSALQIRSKFG